MSDMDKETVFEIARQARTELVRRYAKQKDVLEWGRALFPEKFTLPFCHDLHQYLIDVRGEPWTDTEAPRYHAKTLIQCFLIPLFQAVEEPETFQHYMNVQSTATKAVTVNLAIRAEIENNEIFRTVYGDLVNANKWTEKQFALDVARNGRSYEIIFSAVGAGESIRGFNYKNVRPDYIIVDDLYDEDDIHNIESTRKKGDWFWGALYPSRAKSKRCAIHVQGTAINKADLMEELKGKDRWVSQTFKAITDMDAKTVLWPALNNFDDLMADRADMGTLLFSREMQNERRNSETSTIKEEWLCYHDEIPDDVQIRARNCGVDPSIGEKPGNDFTGMVVVYVSPIPDTRAYRYWIEEIVEDHMSLNQRVHKLDNMDERHKFTAVPIEGIAGFRDFVAEVKRRTNLPVRTVANVKNKLANLERESGKFEARRVSISRKISAKLRDRLVEQLTSDVPANDDIRDALFLAIDSKVSGQVTCESL